MTWLKRLPRRAPGKRPVPERQLDEILGSPLKTDKPLAKYFLFEAYELKQDEMQQIWEAIPAEIRNRLSFTALLANLTENKENRHQGLIQSVTITGLIFGGLCFLATNRDLTVSVFQATMYLGISAAIWSLINGLKYVIRPFEHPLKWAIINTLDHAKSSDEPELPEAMRRMHRSLQDNLNSQVQLTMVRRYQAGAGLIAITAMVIAALNSYGQAVLVIFS